MNRMSNESAQATPPIERPRMDADIVCVGFGPATAGFLTTLSKQLTNVDGTPAVESAVAPGMPPQVLCYERADDIGFGVSGVVTKARALRTSIPEIAGIPMAAPVGEEKVLYLLDPIGASRRSPMLKLADGLIGFCKWALPIEDYALNLPWTPDFLHKHGGMVLSMGQFMQWVGAQVQSTGTVQIWPGTPVSRVLIEDSEPDLVGRVTPCAPGLDECGSGAHGVTRPTSAAKVLGVRLLDQGVNKQGAPGDGFTPGMDIHAALTVVGDGPMGPVGQKLNEHFGFPKGHHQRDWAIGMKMVVELPEKCEWKPGMVLHTFGYPEPEIFGFLYIHPNRMASLGIFVPSWFDSPVRTCYRYLQHWITHPYLWKNLEGSVMHSWGAKSLQESGKCGEPYLAGDGYARIGEGSGSTNVLTGSGIDEAWATGVQLAEAVIELSRAGKSFTKENIEATYVARRRKSWVEKEGKAAAKARDGFQEGFIRGLLGMGLTGMTGGLLNMPGRSKRPHERIPSLEDYYKGKISPREITEIRRQCDHAGVPLYNALMDRVGWPKIAFDGKLLVSHQDALLMGGKVQAPSGFADHVIFTDPEICKQCGAKVCIEACSGQAIMPGEGGVPQFEREKCIFCGACMWNCSKASKQDPERSNVEFRAGAGGLHSTIN